VKEVCRDFEQVKRINMRGKFKGGGALRRKMAH